MPSPAASKTNPRTLAVCGAVVVALAALVLWLNFGRSRGEPSPAALNAARQAADEMSAQQPVPDPQQPPVPSPSKPTPMGR